MKQKVVGTYPMGFDSVQLVLREDTGGEFYRMPELGSCARVKIGADQEDWAFVVTVLLHEVLELAADVLLCRFSATSCVGKDHGEYVFLLDHVRFQEVVARTAEVMTACLPDLSVAWKEWKDDRDSKESPGPAPNLELKDNP